METAIITVSRHAEAVPRKWGAFDIFDLVMSFQNGIFASPNFILRRCGGPENQGCQRRKAVFYLWMALPVFAGLKISLLDKPA